VSTGAWNAVAIAAAVVAGLVLLGYFFGSGR
jgi:hypothetical protein